MLPVELIDIDSLSNQAFDIEESVELARELLEELNVSFEFEDDKWAFENHLSGGTINLDFTRAETLNGFARSRSFPNLKTVIKCWIASLGNGVVKKCAV